MHQPGPYERRGHEGLMIVDCMGYLVAHCALPATAPLLTAAPDLLAACKRLRRRAETGRPIQVGDVEALDKAIAKAEYDALSAAGVDVTRFGK